METTFSFIDSNREAIFLFACFGLTYFLLTGFKLQKNWTCYFGGVFLMLAGLMLSHEINTSMPFTIHMSIHMLLLLICAPLMVIGLPNLHDAHASQLDRVSRFLFTRPLFCWMTGVGIMWFWHIPAIFESLMSTHHQSFSWLSITHVGSLLIAGFIFSWPIVHPYKAYRIDPPVGIVYLFTACIACSLLGMLITFAPPEIYQSIDISMIARRPINPSDQQAAGLMMWVPGCFLYLFGVLYIARNWLKEPNRSQSVFTSPLTLHPDNHD